MRGLSATLRENFSLRRSQAKRRGRSVANEKMHAMPIYEYACTACGERTEAKQSFADPPLQECPVCGGKLRKLYSPVGIVFKGSGFYSTDKKGQKRDRGEKKDSEGSKSQDNKKASSSEKPSSSSSEKSSGDKPSGSKAVGSKSGSDSGSQSSGGRR